MMTFILRNTRAAFFSVSVLLVLVATGCGSSGISRMELTLKDRHYRVWVGENDKPLGMAIGSLLTLSVHHPKSRVDKEEPTLVKIGKGVSRSVADASGRTFGGVLLPDMKDVQSSDLRIVRVVLFDEGKLVLQALREGSAMIQVSTTDGQSHSIRIKVAAIARVEMRAERKYRASSTFEDQNKVEYLAMLVGTSPTYSLHYFDKNDQELSAENMLRKEKFRPSLSLPSMGQLNVLSSHRVQIAWQKTGQTHLRVGAFKTKALQVVAPEDVTRIVLRTKGAHFSEKVEGQAKWIVYGKPEGSHILLQLLAETKDKRQVLSFAPPYTLEKESLNRKECVLSQGVFSMWPLTVAQKQGTSCRFTARFGAATAEILVKSFKE